MSDIGHLRNQTRIYYVSNETIPTLRVLTISGTSSTNEPLVQGIRICAWNTVVTAWATTGRRTFRKCLSTADPCRDGLGKHDGGAVNLLAQSRAGVGYTDSKTSALGAGIVVGPFGDHYKRHAYTAVVRLMNPAGRREL